MDTRDSRREMGTLHLWFRVFVFRLKWRGAGGQRNFIDNSLTFWNPTLNRWGTFSTRQKKWFNIFQSFRPPNQPSGDKVTASPTVFDLWGQINFCPVKVAGIFKLPVPWGVQKLNFFCVVPATLLHYYVVPSTHPCESPKFGFRTLN